MSRWQFDDAQQRRVRDLVIGPAIYAPYSLDGRYVYVQKGSGAGGRLVSLLQKRLMVDTLVQSRNGGMYAIEEKIVRWPGFEYPSITLETMSCTIAGHESDGWMRYGKADFLNYAMCQANGDVVVYLIDFAKLQSAFWPAVANFRETVTTQSNQTACRIVPLKWVRDTVGLWSMRIPSSPEGARAVIEYNGTSYRPRSLTQQPDLFSPNV